MNKILAIALLSVLAIVGCDGTAVHKVKVADADLASALNKASHTVIDLGAQGTITVAERNSILPRLADATVLSDRIDDCTKPANATATLQACVTPLLTSLRDDISSTSLGIKNPGAQATFKAVIDGALVIVGTIAAAGGTI